MKETLNIGFTLAAIAVLCGSCHKYPDDPFISTTPPENIISGSWNLKEYKINGVDSVIPQITLNIKEVSNSNSLKKEETFNIGYTQEQGNVSFRNNKKQINFTNYYSASYPPYPKGHLFNDSATFNIQELYGKTLKLNREINHKYYELTFNQ